MRDDECPAAAAQPLMADGARAQPAAPEAGGGDPSFAAGAQRLAAFIERHAPLFALTGAGCSTDSGIPGYRDRDGRWKGADPIRYQAFVREPAARRRYWARSYVGWPRVAAALPNGAHRALAALERDGRLTQLVTQNVDGLHQRAGSRRVIDLHGRLDLVDCLDCGLRLSRRRMQALLAALNPDCPAPDCPTRAAGRMAPDGDVLLDDRQQGAFRVPGCPGCGGVLKPAVVFFGENVPGPRVRRAFDRLAESRAVLVVGSSLAVFSGYRFCLEASKRGLPIALLNRGWTRADDLATEKLSMDCATTLAGALRQLAAPR